MLLFNCPAALRRGLIAYVFGIAVTAFANTPAGAAGIVAGTNTGSFMAARFGTAAGVIERGPLIFDGVAAASGRIASTLPAWLQFPQADLVGWWADGSLMFDARDGARRLLYRVRGAATQDELLSSEPGVTSAVAHPYDAQLLLLITRNPGGSTRLLLQHLDTQVITPLNAQVAPDSPVLWAHDGKRIAFASSVRDGSDVDIYTLDTTVAGAQPRLIAGNVADGTGTGDDGNHVADNDSNHWQLLDWSQDDSRLLLRRALSADRGVLYTVDVGTGQIRPLAADRGASEDAVAPRARSRRAVRHALAAPPANPPVQALTARFAPGGSDIDYIGYGDGDYLRLRWLDPGSGATRDLSPAMPHDVRLFDASADGRYLAYVYDDDGLSRLTLIDQHDGLQLHPADLPAGVIRSLRFDRSGRRLALTIDSTRVPRAVYVFDTQTQATTRWTPAQTYGIDPARFVMPTLLHFPTWDSAGGTARQLSAYVYRPPGAGTHPVLLWLHDGPMGAWRPGFDSLLQYFVEQLGFVVIAPDVRGSGGYGRAFAALADGRLRADAARDIGALLVWIGAQRDLDSAHVVAMGEGYGGYLALQALAQYDSRLAGGVDIAGPSDLVSWLTSTAAPERGLLRTLFGDERGIDMRAFLRSVSPLTAASGIHQPLLIVQGSANREVPANESEQLLARLRGYHADAGCITVRDAGMDLDDSAGRDAVYGAIAGFLERVAQSKPAPVPPTQPVRTASATAAASAPPIAPRAPIAPVASPAAAPLAGATAGRALN